MKTILKRLSLLLLGAAIALFFVSCSHPIVIVGNGDVTSASGERDCYLEDFLAGEDNCSKNYAINDYTETYYAVPREGWQFDQWVNYCTNVKENQCSFNVPAETVHQFWGGTAAPLQAVFTRIEECDKSDKDCDGFEITGEPEVVFDWSREACEDHDIPDLPPRAFKNRDGQVHLIAGDLRSIGPDLNNQTHLCDGVIPSHADPDPAKFNDDEMTGGFFTEDGEIIYALVHNEYHGWEHPGQCTSNEAFACWYNAVTLAISSNGGASFQHSLAPPSHLVASYPETYVIDFGPSGAFSPSSIVKGADDAYYAMIRVTSSEHEYMWSCLMRSDDLADPDSWRFWDGDDFDGHFVNPYTDSFEKQEDHVCASVNSGNIGMNPTSLTYNEYLDQYMLLGDSSDGDTEGFYYTLSKDLFNWTPQRLIFEGPPPGSELNLSNTGYLYASFLDPESTSRSFDTIGKTAYLYYTRFNDTTGGSGDRDLIRIPVEFFRY